MIKTEVEIFDLFKKAIDNKSIAVSGYEATGKDGVLSYVVIDQIPKNYPLPMYGAKNDWDEIWKAQAKYREDTDKATKHLYCSSKLAYQIYDYAFPVTMVPERRPRV